MRSLSSKCKTANTLAQEANLQANSHPALVCWLFCWYLIMIEIKRDIRGYEGLYKISNTGVVYGKMGERKAFLDGRGYLSLLLSKNGEVKNFRVHRLVAEHFVDGFNDGLQVNHIDGVKTNNNSSNLEWVSQSENSKHAIELGLFTPKKSLKHNRFKSPIQIHKGGFGYVVFGSNQIISTGFKTSSVYGCANGRQTWAGNGFKAERINKLRQQLNGDSHE